MGEGPEPGLNPHRRDSQKKDFVGHFDGRSVLPHAKPATFPIERDGVECLLITLGPLL